MQVYNKSADQPAHPHTLISAYFVHRLYMTMPPVSIVFSFISLLRIVSLAEQPCLSLTLMKNPG